LENRGGKKRRDNIRLVQKDKVKADGKETGDQTIVLKGSATGETRGGKRQEKKCAQGLQGNQRDDLTLEEHNKGGNFLNKQREKRKKRKGNAKRGRR